MFEITHLPPHEGNLYRGEGRAGWDIILHEPVEIKPHETKKIKTAVRFPDGLGNYIALLMLRSSYQTSGLIMPCVGLIDSNYTDYIFITVHNITDKPISLKKNERIAQLLFLRTNV